MTVADDFSDSISSQCTEEDNLIIFCKQMLKTRVFQGSYQERRHVENLKGYRDLIVVDNCEPELKGDLKYIQHRLKNFYKNPDLWIGITFADMIGAPAGTCIWTDIEGTPFGKYWFQIKSIRFKKNEIFVKLKPLRLVSSDTTRVSAENQEDVSIESFTIDNVINLLLEWKDAVSSSIMTFLATDINRENIISTIRFISLLFLSLITGSIELIKFLGIFAIRLFVETRIFLHTATPIILKIIDLVSKVIGGFFIILTMIWRDLICAVRGKPPGGPMPGLAAPVRQYRPIADRPFYTDRRRAF